MADNAGLLAQEEAHLMDDPDPFALAVPIRLSCGAEVEVPLAFCDDLFYLDLLDQLVRAVRSSNCDDPTPECIRLVRRLSDYIDPGAAMRHARPSTTKTPAPGRKMRQLRFRW